MARFFFNIHDGTYSPDDEGVDFESLEDVRKAAMEALPQIAADEIPADGDRRHFVVVVTDEHRRPVYTATLSYTGIWLDKAVK